MFNALRFHMKFTFIVPRCKNADKMHKLQECGLRGTGVLEGLMEYMKEFSWCIERIRANAFFENSYYIDMEKFSEVSRILFYIHIKWHY